MYLKRLEIQGFKSFPNKVSLDFREGITAVVGPNGSGKSNIADALRWVLGEQSAKSLRGGKMEDIIFSGTAARKPVGFAEVSVIFDNTDRRLAPEYSEIKVTRRIYRMGEGEFALNGVTCRLKDIHALFMDTGLGREGYSIVGQGRIDEIIGSRADTRRYLFEEAAGIVKFKARKTEAEDKLAREAANLVRVDDILTELATQLPTLASQADKAREYISLRDRQKHILANLFLADITTADAHLAQLDAAIDVSSAQAAEEEASRVSLETALAQAKEEAECLHFTIKSAEAALAENRQTHDQHEHDIRLHEEQCSHLESQISGAESRHSKAQQRHTEITQALHDTRVKHSELEAAITAAAVKTQQLEAQAAGHLAEAAQREQTLENLNAKLIESVKLSGQAEAKAANIDGVIHGLVERKRRIDEEAALAVAALQSHSNAEHEAQGSLAAAEAQLAESLRIIAESEAQRAESEALHAEQSKKYEHTRKTLSDAESRHRALSELKDNYEGYNRAVKSLMKERHRHPGILGAVGELCTPAKGYEIAIDISLGANAQNIITTDEQSATTAIEHLKAAKAGRATFLPLSAIKPQPPISRGDLLAEEGVCGTALSLVSFDARFEKVFSGLLGRTLVVETMQHAVRISRKYGQSVRIVTLSGELLSVGGAITGGSRWEKSSGTFERSREISDLQHALTTMREDAQRLSENLQQALARLRALVGSIAEQRSEAEEISRRRHILAEQALKLAADAAATQEHQERLTAEDKALATQLHEANTHKATLEAEREAALQAARQAEHSIAALQSTLQSGREDRDERAGELTALKVELGAREQEQRNLETEQARLEQEQVTYTAELADLCREITANRAQLTIKRESITTLAAAKVQLAAQGLEASSRLENLENTKKQRQASQQQLETALKTSGETLARLQADMVRLTTQREYAGTERRKLFDTMWDDYQLTPSGARSYPQLEEPTDALRREERGIRAKISQMGGVNANAIEEHQAVRERFEQMTTQRDDIVSAREDLRALITELEALMERQFKEQFALISESFSTAFTQMFGGGKAYLRLLDESNALESGIDIVAQPPGKALASMSLLSGGERALTALALLFGILRLRPSPFVILDEVESALDEANVARFANYLRNVAAKDTQFIMITHRRGAMEAADILYGVTMEERGVTKVLSIEL